MERKRGGEGGGRKVSRKGKEAESEREATHDPTEIRLGV